MMGQSKTMKKAAKKVVGTLFSKTLWIARGTSVVMGLAVMLALVVGVASTALAGTGVGAAFNLGVTNTVGQITKLVGSVAGPSLQVDNNSTNSAATALDLQVEPGKAPMKVNSGTKVTNLNADKIDGQDAADLQGLSDVQVRTKVVTTSANQNGSGTAQCLSGEKAIGGGVALETGNATSIHFFEPGGIPVGNPPTGWFSHWFADDFSATVRVYAVCAS